jgi:hypothetical protein
MRNSMPGLLQPRPEAVRKKENVPSDVRRRGETGLIVKSGLSTLARRTMRVPSRGRMRKTATNLVARMEDHGGIGPIERSPRAKNLGARRRRAEGLAKRGAKEKGLTDQGDTEKNPTMKGLKGQSHQEAKMKDLEDKYTRMLRRMDGEDPELMAWDMLEDESLPFTGRVKAYPMPDKFKMPRIEKYDGNGDPQEHLEAFREHIVLHGTPDEIACRAFPLTLKGVAKDWFTGLPPKSVGTFKDLGRLFLTQFLATRKRKKDPTCLLTLRQDKEESLKDFMLRFNREKLEVDTPDDKTLLCALMQGVRAEGAVDGRSREEKCEKGDPPPVHETYGGIYSPRGAGRSAS